MVRGPLGSALPAALALALGACDREAAPEAAPAAAAEPDAPSQSDEARAACRAFKDAHTNGECGRVARQLAVLGCDRAAADDPACVDQAPKHAACAAEVEAFASTIDRALTRESDPSHWSCEFPLPPPPGPKRSPYGGFKGPEPPRPPPLGREALLDRTCARTYVHLRGFPRADRAVLEHAWRSDGCRQRIGAVWDALSDPYRERWANEWMHGDDEGALPWTTPQAFEAPALARLIAAVDGWCRTTPCTVLGRCVAERLPAEHPGFPGAVVCVAHQDDACQRSQACATEGRCHLDAATRTCIPATDQDCARASICAERKLCRRVAEPRIGANPVWSCGGTVPATSGADLLGFVDNPALGAVMPVLQIESESVTGPLGATVFGLSTAQHADLRACVAKGVAIAPRALRDLQVSLTIKDGAVERVSASFDHDDVGGHLLVKRCIQQGAKAWTFAAATGRSQLAMRATVHAHVGADVTAE